MVRPRLLHWDGRESLVPDEAPKLGLTGRFTDEMTTMMTTIGCLFNTAALTSASEGAMMIVMVMIPALPAGTSCRT